MEQDLRDLMKNEKMPSDRMKSGHEQRFLDLLAIEIPKKKERNNFWILKIAASILLLVGVGTLVYTFNNNVTVIPEVVVVAPVKEDNSSKISIGNLSPGLKKVEDYYLASINLELASIESSKDNDALIKSFMTRLSELNDEYAKLNEELNTDGPNEQTVTALIDNLQLRLQLLFKLKDKINELKKSKNEVFKDQQV